jgi:hypothetical protein
MSTATVAGLLLILLPLAFNAAFGLLAARFDYPDVLRRPTSEVLARFREGGTALVLIWWAFMLTAVLLAPVVVLLASAIGDANSTLLAVGATVGVLAATVQFLGLVRWPFLVPYLARVDAEPGASPARREAVDLVFESFNRYLGVGVGEHLGYALTQRVDDARRRRAHADHRSPRVTRSHQPRRRAHPDGLFAGVRRPRR